jgi:hypothetical protein
MGQGGDGHAHFDQIWRPNITINYMGVDQNIKFKSAYVIVWELAYLDSLDDFKKFCNIFYNSKI